MEITTEHRNAINVKLDGNLSNLLMPIKYTVPNLKIYNITSIDLPIVYGIIKHENIKSDKPIHTRNMEFANFNPLLILQNRITWHKLCDKYKLKTKNLDIFSNATKYLNTCGRKYYKYCNPVTGTVSILSQKTIKKNQFLLKQKHNGLCKI